MAVDYWHKYRLQHDPFTAEKGIASPFVSEGWQKIFELLTNLSHTSAVLLLVTGHEGIGKSTLLQRFTQEVAQDVGICHIQGDKSIEPDILRYLLGKHLGINLEHGGIDYFKEQLLQRCQKMQQCGKKYFLVIDDAHSLPEKTVATILDTLAYLQSLLDNLPLHIVLFGCPALEATVFDINQQHGYPHPKCHAPDFPTDSLRDGGLFQEGESRFSPLERKQKSHFCAAGVDNQQQFNEPLTHVLHIRPLNQEDVHGYLVARMRDAGLKGELPFSDEDVGVISSRSEGVPAKINYVARRLLEKRLESRPRRKKTTQNHRRTNMLLTGSMLVAATMVVGFLVIRHDVESKWVEKVVEMPTDIVLAQEGWLNTDSTANDAAVLSTPSVTAQQTALVSAHAPDVVTKTKSVMPVKVSESAQESSTVKAAPEVKTVAAHSEVKPLKKETKQTASVSANTAHEKQYTVQLVAAGNKDRVQRFLKENHLKNTEIIQTTRQGKPWYVALYGRYDSQQQAVSAINTLPKVVQAQKPWARHTTAADANQAIG